MWCPSSLFLILAFFQFLNLNAAIILGPTYAGVLTNSSSNDYECLTYPMDFQNQVPVTWNKIIYWRCQGGVMDSDIAEQLAIGVLLSGGSYFAASNVYQFHEQQSAEMLEKLFDQSRPRIRSTFETSDELSFYLEDEFDQIYSPVLLSKFLNAATLNLETIMSDFNITTSFPLQHLMLANLEVLCNQDDGSTELRICMRDRPTFGYLEISEKNGTSKYSVKTPNGSIVADCCHKKRGICVCKARSDLKSGEECDPIELMWDEEKSAENDTMIEVEDEKIENEEEEEEILTTTEASFLQRGIVDVEMVWNNYLMPQSTNQIIRFAISFSFGSILTILVISIIKCAIQKRKKRVPLHAGMISQPIESQFEKTMRPLDSQKKAQLAAELSTKLQAVIENGETDGEEELCLELRRPLAVVVETVNERGEIQNRVGGGITDV